MVVGFGLILIQVNAFPASSVPYSANGTSQNNWDNRRLFSSWGGKMNSADQATYIRTVHMMLDNAEQGAVGEFTGQETSGMVRVLFTQDNGYQGYCRVFESRIEFRGDIRRYVETACLEQGRKSWVFYNNIYR